MQSSDSSFNRSPSGDPVDTKPKKKENTTFPVGRRGRVPVPVRRRGKSFQPQLPGGAHGPDSEAAVSHAGSFSFPGRGREQSSTTLLSKTRGADFEFEEDTFTEKSAADHSLDAEIEGPPERTLLIRDLPPQATAKQLEQLISDDCSRDKPEKVKVKVFGDGTAKAVLENMKAVGILWKRRHVTSGSARVLVYNGEQLNWDIAEEDKCDKDKFLIENVPLEMTEDELVMRVKSCYETEALKRATLKPQFTDESGGHKKCLMSVSDPVVDKDLVENMAPAEFIACRQQLPKLTDISSRLQLQTRKSLTRELRAGAIDKNLKKYLPTKLTLSPHDGSGLNANILNFLWGNEKECHALKQAIGSGFDVHWQSDVKKLVIKPKEKRKARFENWEKKCKKKFKAHQDKYVCKEFDLADCRLGDRLIAAVKKDEKHLSGDIAIYKHSKRFLLAIVGNHSNVSASWQALSSAVSGWKKELEESEAISVASVDVQTVGMLTAVMKSSLFSVLREKRPNATFEANSSRWAIDIKTKKKDLTVVRKEVEDVVNCFGCRCIDIHPTLAYYFSDKGVLSAIAKMRESILDALILKQTDEKVVQVFGLKDNLRSLTLSVRKFLKDEYRSYPLSTNKPEVKEFLRSAAFAKFVAQSISQLDAVLLPALGDIMEGASSFPFAFEVFGSAKDAQAASKTINEFLDHHVIYRVDVALPSHAHGRFVKKFRLKELREIEKTLTQQQAKIEVAESRSDRLVLQANQAGIPLAEREVETFVQSIGKSSEIIEKHGLVRFLESEQFTKEKNHIQHQHNVIVCTSLDKEEREATPLVSSGFPVKLHRIGEFSGVENPSRSVVLVKGDICNHEVDAIVNSANEDLQHIGGLAAYIKAQAGNSVQKECNAYIKRKGKLPTGQAMYTKPGNLKKAKHVIHAVGPRWPSFVSNTVEIGKAELSLMSAVSSSIKLASKLKCSSVAIPAISSGIFGCPSEECAKHVVKAVASFVNDTGESPVKSIHLVMKPEDYLNVTAFEKELKSHAQLKEKLKWLSAKPEVPAKNRRKSYEEKPKIVSFPSMAEAISLTSSINVVVKHGNIVNEEVDVVINSTTSSLSLNSALTSKALSRAAGPGLQQACSEFVKKNGKIWQGGVAVTDGYNLSCKKIVHTLCPKEPKALAELVSTCLKTASSMEASSVAIPALGTGNLGVSNADSAKAIFAGIQDFQKTLTAPSSIRDIFLVIFDQSRVSAYLSEQSSQSLTAATASFSEPALATRSPALPLVSQNQVQLPNGCILSIEQGDIVKSASDIIVVPTDSTLSFSKGMVSVAVLAAGGPSLQDDIQTNYPFGVTSGKMADISGGLLRAKRVYALACRRWNQKMSSRSNIDSLRESILECLLAADRSGYSSISFPALGTGNLGYSDTDAADAIFQAAAEFSLQLSSPSLQNVGVTLFDAYRLAAFTERLQAILPAGSGKGSGFGATLSRWFGKLSGLFSSVRKVLEVGSSLLSRSSSMSQKLAPDALDVVEIAVIGDSSQTALKELVHAIHKECVKEAVPGEYPENLDPEKVEEMKRRALSDHVVLSVEEQPKSKDSKPTIFLAGWTKDCHKAMKMVNEEIMKYWKKNQEKEVARARKANICWSWYREGEGFCSFAEQLSSSIESAFEEKTTITISLGEAEYFVDPVNRKITSLSGQAAANIRRDEISEGITLPPTWCEMAASDDEFRRVKLVETSWEYLEVVKKFEATGEGIPQQILRIERIQNQRLYRSFVKEREQIMKKGSKHCQTGSVERQLWHGTDEKVVEQIIANGFNRSYAGTKVGRRLGSGVYFAVNSSYSVGYASRLTGDRHMFLCNVLVGMYRVGSEEMIEPPIIDGKLSKVERYDSLVDNVSDPTIYAACFRDHQVYPDYLISFR
eukprot:m.261870 g.261870  ORF g.261870 m.261870 type:complete len:1887 (+) comp40450_c0_seq1:83-5743(+)